MGQFTVNGVTYEELPNGKARVVAAPSLANPKLPGELTSQNLSNTRTKQEIDLANATASSTAAKTKAEAAKAQLDLKNAQEAYAAGHPKGTGATVLGLDALKTMPVPDQEIVKALGEGRLAFPAGFALKAPWWQQKLEQVAQVYPDFDATNYNNRAKARAMLLNGKVGTSANALNTMIGHAGLLDSQIPGTASHSVTGVNAVENWIDQHLLGQSGITNYKDTAGKLASEETSVYRNGGGAEADVNRYLQSFDPNAAEKQKHDVVRNTLDLAASKQAANLYQYNLGSGGKPQVDLLDPDARKVLDQFPDIRDKYFAPSAAPLSAQAAALLKANGGTPPPPGAPPPVDPNAPPPPINGGPGGVPHADYSSMVGGPQQSVAQQGYRNVADPETTAGVNALLHRGKSYDAVAAYASSRGYPGLITDRGTFDKVEAYAKSHPGFQAVAEATKPVPTTFWQRFSGSPTAAGIAGFGSGLTAGLDDVAGRKLAGPAYDANRAALAATHPGADLAGNVVGGAAGMFAGGGLATKALGAGVEGGLASKALAFALKHPKTASGIGDAAYGSAYGASENPDDPLSGAGMGALVSPLASVGGQYLTKGAGAALQGVTDPAVQRLRAAGIPLTVGEVLGGGAKKAQDAMTSVFGPGNMVSRRYGEGREALNSAAFNQAGQTIGQPINAVGQSGIRALDAAKNQAYSNALDPISLNLNQPEAINGIGGALNSAKAIPNVDQARDIATGGLANYIGNAAPDGLMSGPDFQQAYRGLSRLGRQSKDRIYGHEIGQSLGQGQDALVGALQNQNPGAFDAFLNANSANRHLSVLTDAVNAAKNQIGPSGEPLFTPAQLGTAASGNARTYSGKVASASGNRPFNQLAMDAQQVMSSKLPESGTYPRALIGAALTGGAGGMFGGQANGAQGAAEGALVPLSLLTLLGTRRGQKLLTAALANRSAGSQLAGQMLARNPQVGGDILTAAGLPLLTGP